MSLMKDDKRAVDALEVMKAEQKKWEEICRQVSAELEAAQKKLSEYQEILGDAAEAYDADAFEEAKAKITGTEFTIEMAQMRLERLKTKGFATKEEVMAAVMSYESRVKKLNAKACKAIVDGLAAIQETVDAADKEARAALIKEKELCELCGIEFDPVHGNLAAVDGAIFAKSFLRKLGLNRLPLQKSLFKFASQA